MAVATARWRRGARAGTSRVVGGSRFRVGAVVRFAYILLFLAFVVFPLYWVATMSIKPVDEYQTIPPHFYPHHPTMIHFPDALHHYRGLHGLENSLIIASATTVLSVLIGTSMAYSLARFRTGGKQLAFWVLSQRFLPPVAIVIPVFLMYRDFPLFHFSLYDRHLGLILLYTVFTLPLSVWMMYAYFRQMPAELEEAALVDGCSRWQALWKIAWPLAAPGIVSAAAFAFIFSWTEFFFALVLTTSKAITLPALFPQFLGFQGAQFGESSALTMLSIPPAIILGLLVQRHLVRGLTLGAIQG